MAKKTPLEQELDEIAGALGAVTEALCRLSDATNRNTAVIDALCDRQQAHTEGLTAIIKKIKHLEDHICPRHDETRPEEARFNA